MEHHHHHVDDESNEIVSTIVTDMIFDESQFHDVHQYETLVSGDNSVEDLKDASGESFIIDDLSNSATRTIDDNHLLGRISMAKSSTSNKRGNLTSGIGLPNYRQKYKKMWESIPELKGKCFNG